jgi:NAD(P)H-flavin reductase
MSLMLEYKVVSCVKLPSRVWLITIGATKDCITAMAGQYIFVSATTTDAGLPFSIANYSKDYNTVELHIREQDDAQLQRILSAIKEKQNIFLSSGHGNCTYNSINKNIRNVVISVGGTGFAMAQAVLQAAAGANDNRTWHLYFCATNKKGFYATDVLRGIDKTLSIDVQLITKESTENIDALLCANLKTLEPDQTVIMTAGPYGFVENIYISAKKLGFSVESDYFTK